VAVIAAAMAAALVPLGLAACGGASTPAPLTAAACARWLPVAQVRSILGVRTIRIVTEPTGSTGHLDPGGVICQYEGFATARPIGAASALFLVDAWPHVADARRVYDDYVKGLSGPVTALANLGTRAAAAPDVVVVLTGDSVVTIGTNDRALAARVVGRI
jgi:hypothetical protein